MKKLTIVLIVICIVSLILGIIFSVASILSLRSYGMSKIGEFWGKNKDNWSLYDVRVETDDGTDVFVRIPLPDRYYDEDTGEYEGPFFDINVRSDDGRVWIEKYEPPVETVTDEGGAPGITDETVD